jgi:hypothetical protein
MENIYMPSDGTPIWFGYGHGLLFSPNSLNKITLKYIGEPPHGDSYHTILINEHKFPGYAWGCMFSFSQDSRYFSLSWMEKLFDRKTIIIDCENMSYTVLEEYFWGITFSWPSVLSYSEKQGGLKYVFTGNEEWISVC